MGSGESIASSAPTLLRLTRRFWPQLRKRWRLLAGSFVAMFGEVLFRLLEPWPLKFVFDRMFQAGDTQVPNAGVAGWSASLSGTALLSICAVALVVIVLGRASVTYLRRVGFALVGDRVLTEVRSELFAHLQRLSLSFHGKARTGDLLARVTNDVARLKEVVSTAAMPLIAHGVSVFAMAIVMVVVNWRLSLVVLAVIPAFWLATRRIGRQIQDTARRERQRHGAMGAVAQEAIASIRVVQTLGIEDVHGKNFTAQNEGTLAEGVKGKRLSARLLGVSEVLIAMATAGVLWYGGRLVLMGELTPGDLVVFMAYVRMACRPVRNMAKYTARLAKASASAERILEVLDASPTIHDRPNAIEAPEQIERISFEGVRFGYEEDCPVLHGIDIEARRGQAIALVGRSGAGKSTIVNLLVRLYDPWEGRICLDGTDIRDLKVASLRRRIAIVPQDTTLFAATARENIACGDPNISDEDVIEAARLACAHEFIMDLPQGYDTLLGERGESLSFGQRQRIAMARAAVRRAPILVLDEPTASLDSENTRLICEAIRNLRRNRICFIITHDLTTVREADHIVVLDSGRIVERGSHEELLRRAGLYSELCALQGVRLADPDTETADAGAR